MQIGWLILGVLIGVTLCACWRRLRRGSTANRLIDQAEADTDARNVLNHVRVGIAKQHRDIAETLNQMEAVIIQTGAEEESEALRSRLLELKKSLSSCLADAYDALRKVATTDTESEGRSRQTGRQAMEQFMKDRLAIRDRYLNPFSLVIFYVDAKVDERTLMDMLHQLMRITDRAFSVGPHEFVIVLPETQLGGAVVFAERGALRLTDAFGARTFAGVTTACDGDSARTILNRADTALYRARSDEEHFVFSHDGHSLEAHGNAEADYVPLASL